MDGMRKYLNKGIYKLNEKDELIIINYKRKLKSRAKKLRQLKKIPYLFLVRCFPHEHKNCLTDYLIKNNYNRNLTGCEIGVGNGINAYSMLSHLNINTMYLIDPYEPFHEGDDLVTNYCNFFNEAKERLGKYDKNVKFIKKFSSNAVDDVPDKLDFIWFDATGNYKVTKNFLKQWYKKIKPGGIIGGKRFNSNWIGLCKAVIEFTNENNLELNGGASGDWWIVKQT